MHEGRLHVRLPTRFVVGVVYRSAELVTGLSFDTTSRGHLDTDRRSTCNIAGIAASELTYQDASMP